jgi:hypothetical protein
MPENSCTHDQHRLPVKSNASHLIALNVTVNAESQARMLPNLQLIEFQCLTKRGSGNQCKFFAVSHYALSELRQICRDRQSSGSKISANLKVGLKKGNYHRPC